MCDVKNQFKCGFVVKRFCHNLHTFVTKCGDKITNIRYELPTKLNVAKRVYVLRITQQHYFCQIEQNVAKVMLLSNDFFWTFNGSVALK